MTVAAIASVFIVMVVAEQNQQQSGGGGGTSTASSSQKQSTTPGGTDGGQQQAALGGNGTTGMTITITIPQGAATQQAQQYYQPQTAQVQPGSQVTWQNQDSAQHTATASDGSFDTGVIPPSSSGSATVQGQGTIDYYCTIHPWMTASLQVIGSEDGSAAQQQPTAQVSPSPQQEAPADQLQTQTGSEQQQQTSQQQNVTTSTNNNSDALQTLRQLSPNDLAQILSQSKYEDAAAALQQFNNNNTATFTMQ